MPLAKGKSKKTVSKNISEMVHAGHPQDQAIAAAMRIARENVGQRRKKAEGGRTPTPKIRDNLPPPREMPYPEGAGREIEPELYITQPWGAHTNSLPGARDHSEVDVAERPKRAAAGEIDSSHPDYGHTGHERAHEHEKAHPAPEQPKAEEPAPTQSYKTHSGPISSPVAGRTDHLPMNVKSGSHVLPADVIAALGQGNTAAGFKVARDLFAVPKWYKGMPYKAEGLPFGATDPGRAEGGRTKNVPIIAAGGEHVLSPDEIEYQALRHGSDNRDDGHSIVDEFIKQIRKQHIKTLRKLPGPAKN